VNNDQQKQIDEAVNWAAAEVEGALERLMVALPEGADVEGIVTDILLALAERPQLKFLRDALIARRAVVELGVSFEEPLADEREPGGRPKRKTKRR